MPNTDSSLALQSTSSDSPLPTKPGYLTTEFWLEVAAFALTALYASGVMPTTGTIATIAAIAATMLSALGYTVSRTFVKTAASSAAAPSTPATVS